MHLFSPVVPKPSLRNLMWPRHTPDLPYITLYQTIHPSLALRLRIAQKPSIVWSLGPKTLYYESLEPSGSHIPLLHRGTSPLASSLCFRVYGQGIWWRWGHLDLQGQGEQVSSWILDIGVVGEQGNRKFKRPHHIYIYIYICIHRSLSLSLSLFFFGLGFG